MIKYKINNHKKEKKMISFKEFCNISESEDIRTPIGNFERKFIL